MKQKISASLLIAGIISAAAFLFIFNAEERTMLKLGTFVKIRLAGPRWLDFDSAFRKAFGAVDRVDSIANIYNNDSELYKLNKRAHNSPVSVSPSLFSLISESVKLSRDSDGAFDITIRPLAALWQIPKGRDSIPSKEEIRETLSLVGWDKLILDSAKGSVMFDKEGMAIDLSAIAKGYAVDAAVAELRSAGFRSAVVNAGGDIYCMGRKHFFRSWSIGITDPRNKSEIKRVLYIHDKAVATSGGYEQYFQYKGKGYTHIIEPRTGYPIGKIHRSVTVIAPTCMLADGIATAVYAGGGPVADKLHRLYPGIKIILED